MICPGNRAVRPPGCNDDPVEENPVGRSDGLKTTDRPVRCRRVLDRYMPASSVPVRALPHPSAVRRSRGYTLGIPRPGNRSASTSVNCLTSNVVSRARLISRKFSAVTVCLPLRIRMGALNRLHDHDPRLRDQCLHLGSFRILESIVMPSASGSKLHSARAQYRDLTAWLDRVHCSVQIKICLDGFGRYVFQVLDECIEDVTQPVGCFFWSQDRSPSSISDTQPARTSSSFVSAFG